MTAGAAVYSVSGAIALARLALSPARRDRIGRLPKDYLFCCGLLFVAYMFLLFLAVGLARDRQQTLEIGMLNYLWPALTILFSVPVLGKRAGWLLAPGTGLALSGVFLVLARDASATWASMSGNLASNPVAYVLAVAAGVSWALYSVLTGRWAGGARTGGVDLFLPATALFLLASSAFAGETSAWNARSFAEALFLGGATYLAYEFWDSAMRTGHVVTVAAASYFTPLLSSAASCIYLAVAVGPSFWTGAVLLVAGSLLSWYSVSDHRPGQEAGSVYDEP